MPQRFFHHYFLTKRSLKKNEKTKKEKVTFFDSDSEGSADESPNDMEGDAGDNAELLAEEAALQAGESDDDGSGQEDGYGGMDPDDFYDDSDNETGFDMNDPTEAQLEALLLEDEDLDSDSDMDTGPTAFAAAEEYAKLLEDDVDERTVEAFRAQHRKKKKGTTPTPSKPSVIGKRKNAPTGDYKKNFKKQKR